MKAGPHAVVQSSRHALCADVRLGEQADDRVGQLGVASVGIFCLVKFIWKSVEIVDQVSLLGGVHLDGIRPGFPLCARHDAPECQLLGTLEKNQGTKYKGVGGKVPGTVLRNKGDSL